MRTVDVHSWQPCAFRQQPGLRDNRGLGEPGQRAVADPGQVLVEYLAGAEAQPAPNPVNRKFRDPFVASTRPG